MRVLIILAAGLAAAACTTVKTADFTTHKLVADAAHAAVESDRIVCRPDEDSRTHRCVGRGQAAYVRALAGDDAADAKVAVSLLRQALSLELRLVDDVKAADVLIDVVVKAAGVDASTFTVGLPAMTIPAIPGETSEATTFPGLSLYSRNLQRGGVELSVTATDAHTGANITAVDLFGESLLQSASALTGFTWGRFTAEPGIQTRGHAR